MKQTTEELALAETITAAILEQRTMNPDYVHNCRIAEMRFIYFLNLLFTRPISGFDRTPRLVAYGRFGGSPRQKPLPRKERTLKQLPFVPAPIIAGGASCDWPRQTDETTQFVVGIVQQPMGGYEYKTPKFISKRDHGGDPIIAERTRKMARLIGFGGREILPKDVVVGPITPIRETWDERIHANQAKRDVLHTVQYTARRIPETPGQAHNVTREQYNPHAGIFRKTREASAAQRERDLMAAIRGGWKGE